MNAPAPGRITEDEIRSQPDTWARTLHEGTALRAPSDVTSLILTGCGSTFYLARWAARHAQRDVPVPLHAVPASDLLVAPDTWPGADGRVGLIAISRSGATSETVRVAQNWPGPVAGVTCEPESPLAHGGPDRLILPHAAERSVVQTRSFTNMMLGALSLFRPPPEGLAEQLEVQGQLVVERSPAAIRNVVDEGLPRRFVVLGSGARYGLACEAALKLTEVALVEAHAFHSLEVRHGPMSMVGPGTLVIGLLEGEAPFERDVLTDMEALGADTLRISVTPHSSDAPVAPDEILPTGWRDILALPPVHLLALAIAHEKGLDPDRPHNLDAVVHLDV